jgi:hypothetical protein
MSCPALDRRHLSVQNVILFVTDGFLLLPWFPFGKTRILILQKASN